MRFSRGRRSALRLLPGVFVLPGCAALQTCPTSAPPAADAAAPSTLPVAPVRPVSEVFYGTTVTDPYRYFENPRDPEVAAWMKAHGDAARQRLDALPERAAFHERLQALDQAASERVMRLQRTADGSLFYLQRGVGDDQFRLVVRAPGQSEPRVLVDPAALAREGSAAGPMAINFFRASPLGTRVGYGLSRGGSEAAVLHVIDVASGQALMAPMDRADSSLPGWVDEQLFIVNRLRASQPGDAPTAKYQHMLTMRVRLGESAPESQVDELPVRRWPGLNLTPDMEVGLRRLGDGPLALLTVGDGVRSELAFYVGPWNGIANPATRWKRVAGFDAGITGYTLRAQHLIAMTHRRAPRFRIVEYDLRRPGQAPREVVGASSRVTTALHAARDGLYFVSREGNAQQLWRVPHRPGALPQAIALPVRGQIVFGTGFGGPQSYQAEQDGLVLGLQSWLQALQYYELKPGGVPRPLGLPQGAPDESAEFAATEVLVTSHDGAQVPMSIVHRKDVRRDGRNPVWLTAYAAYGFTISPAFDPARRAWLERGGVLAFANPRGSGVFGNAWYQAGKQATKPNSWKDTIACAEYLVRDGWTSPRQLGLSGRSAGGLLAGRVLTERPDLFAAVVPQVGALDMLRMEFTANGPGNIPEFGSVTNEAGFRALLAMSPYHHVYDGTAYPAVLLTHGVNDPRVDVWASTKMAARLLAASSSQQPIWLALRYDAGHGIGNTRSQQLDDNADVYAFMWSRLAQPGAAAVAPATAGAAASQPPLSARPASGPLSG